MATVFAAAGYRTAAFVGAFVLDDRYGLGRGFDHYDDRLPAGGADGFVYAERRAETVVQSAGDWILAAGTSPWLAWVHLFDPHAPYDAPPPASPGRAPYDAEVAYTDAMLGRLFDRLRQAGVLDRAVIVVTADHGEALGDHGERTHGLFAYDATLAVPLIVSGPGVRPGVVDLPVGHVDLLPTLAALAGLPAPAGVDGHSLTEALPADRSVYFEALDANLTRGLGAVDRGGHRRLEIHPPARARALRPRAGSQGGGQRRDGCSPIGWRPSNASVWVGRTAHPHRLPRSPPIPTPSGGSARSAMSPPARARNPPPDIRSPTTPSASSG